MNNILFITSAEQTDFENIEDPLPNLFVDDSRLIQAFLEQNDNVDNLRVGNVEDLNDFVFSKNYDLVFNRYREISSYRDNYLISKFISSQRCLTVNSIKSALEADNNFLFFKVLHRGGFPTPETVYAVDFNLYKNKNVFSKNLVLKPVIGENPNLIQTGLDKNSISKKHGFVVQPELESVSMFEVFVCGNQILSIEENSNLIDTKHPDYLKVFQLGQQVTKAAGLFLVSIKIEATSQKDLMVTKANPLPIINRENDALEISAQAARIINT